MITLVLVSGFAYERIARWRATHSPPPGVLVMVEDRKLHLNCTGDGGPIVVLEAGGGSPSSVWSLVQPEIARFTRVCSYDRAGYQWSESRSGIRDAAHITDELDGLLRSAGEEPPYVMVGHSLGGPYISVYQLQYPANVVGLVYLDPTPVGWKSDADVRPGRTTRLAKSVFRSVARETGLQRLLMRLPESDRSFPASVVESLRRFGPVHVRTARREIDAKAASLRQAAEMRSLGNRPVIVLSRGRAPGSSTEHVDSAAAASLGRWLDAHAQLAELSTNSEHIALENAGHLLQIDRPDAVVEAVETVVRATRSPLR